MNKTREIRSSLSAERISIGMNLRIDQNPGDLEMQIAVTVTRFRDAQGRIAARCDIGFDRGTAAKF